MKFIETDTRLGPNTFATKWSTIEKWTKELSETEKSDLRKELNPSKNDSDKRGTNGRIERPRS